MAQTFEIAVFNKYVAVGEKMRALALAAFHGNRIVVHVEAASTHDRAANPVKIESVRTGAANAVRSRLRKKRAILDADIVAVPNVHRPSGRVLEGRAGETDTF